MQTALDYSSLPNSKEEFIEFLSDLFVVLAIGLFLTGLFYGLSLILQPG